MEQEKEELEGLDDSGVVGWGEYPLDTVFVRTEPRSVAEVVKRIKADRYCLDPEFQRDFVWSREQQSRLIESCLMRIPLPVFYVAEAKDGRIIVVDGLQRLTTFFNFLEDKLTLTGLGNENTENQTQLNGKRFSELSVKLQERIEDTPLTLYILDSKAPERAKLDIFERVNSGVPLTRQQMRNCLYSGPATRWLSSAASSQDFKDATGKSLKTKPMRDREAINRFCAFKLFGTDSYRGDMDGFLAKALEKMNTLPESELEYLMQSFKRSMNLNRQLFGKHAFRKSCLDLRKYKHPVRSVINISFFEVCSVLLSPIEPPLSEAQLQSLREAFFGALSEHEFIHAITYSTNSTSQVKTRFRILKEKIMDAL